MKKLMYLIFAFLGVLFLKINVYADTCPKDEMERLKYLANKVEFTYDYEWKILKKVDDVKYFYPVFNITANNLNSDLKVMIENDYLSGDYQEFKNNGSNSSTLKGFNYGQQINVTIRAYTDNSCSGQLITTKKVNLPYFNPYRFQEICENHLDNEYCAMFFDKNMSRELLLKKLNEMIKNDDVSNKEEDSKVTQNSYDYIYIYIIISLTLIAIITIVLVRKFKNRSL